MDEVYDKIPDLIKEYNEVFLEDMKENSFKNDSKVSQEQIKKTMEKVNKDLETKKS